MKKLFLFFILLVSILVGCGNKYIFLSGESKNWGGKYSANIDGNNEDGSYDFHFKNGDSNTNFRTLEVVINNVNGHILKRDENYKGGNITIPFSCKGCSVTHENEPIKVAIKWNDENEETIYLKQQDK